MRTRRIAFALPVAFLLAQTPCFAWNGTGHRVVAYIAYKQLKENDPATLQRVLAVLRTHPAVGTDLWKNGGINGEDTDLNLFLNAATFPDDVRHGSISPHTSFNDNRFIIYLHITDHFINFRFVPPNKNPAGVAPGSTLAPTYVARLKAVRKNDPGALTNDDDAHTPESRAVSLSYLVHQIGDVHQPLHAVERISERFPDPKGDEGGNFVRLAVEGVGARELHAYWDDLLGTEHVVDTPEKLASVADDVRRAYPAGAFEASDIQAADDLTNWAIESFKLAVTNAYTPLADQLDRERDVTFFPPGYQENALKIAKRRVAQAGYRLAAQLKTLFAQPDSSNNRDR